jgi:DNA-binding Lrp family transcriptional regulator
MGRSAADACHGHLGELERRLIDAFQHGVPLSSCPYADMAAELGVSEEEVLAALRDLRDAGTLSRVGPVFAPNRVGASTLAAMAVPPERLEEVAALVSGYPEVNHNYEREHQFTLWFVVTAPTPQRVAEVLEEIGRRTGIVALDLPLEAEYHIDLGFAVQWN